MPACPGFRTVGRQSSHCTDRAGRASSKAPMRLTPKQLSTQYDALKTQLSLRILKSREWERKRSKPQRKASLLPSPNLSLRVRFPSRPRSTPQGGIPLSFDMGAEGFVGLNFGFESQFWGSGLRVWAGSLGFHVVGKGLGIEGFNFAPLVSAGMTTLQSFCP